MGSTNFAEQTTVAELYAQVLEANGFTVERRLNLGSREIVAPALESGQIDMYPEYMATMLAFTTSNQQSGSSDPAATAASLTQALAPKGITLLDYAPAIDTNALVVTRATAQRLNLKTTSDLVPHMNDLVLGGPPECPDRPFCIPGFRNVYGLTFKDFRPLDAGGPITVAALDAGQIDVALLFSSDAVIAARGFVTLEDDKHLQLADNVAPVIRTQVLNAAPNEIRMLTSGVSRILTTEELIGLNRQVGIDRMDPKDAAGAWLKAKRLIP
ncbi:MAG TPA: ABC transporter substrate-binding protein [Chloroflexota bacterium]|jgi:osmoprotectant transport system substrate-binding protein|nr:ABC transporter substrate-binding protein [Chloroflexota bacterium]